MDAARCPSLRCILKQCLKLAQDAVYGQQKTFAPLGLSKRGSCLRKGIEIFKGKMRQCKRHR